MNIKIRYTKKDKLSHNTEKETQIELSDEESKMIAQAIIAHIIESLRHEVGRSTISLMKKALFLLLFIIAMYIFAIETKIYDWLKSSPSIQMALIVPLWIKHKWVNKPNHANQRDCEQRVKIHRWYRKKRKNDT